MPISGISTPHNFSPAFFSSFPSIFISATLDYFLDLIDNGSCRAFPDFPVPGNGKFIIPYAPYFMISTFSLKPASKLSKSFFQIFFLHGLLYTILWTESLHYHLFIIAFPSSSPFPSRTIPSPCLSAPPPARATTITLHCAPSRRDSLPTGIRPEHNNDDTTERDTRPG